MIDRHQKIAPRAKHRIFSKQNKAPLEPFDEQYTVSGIIKHTQEILVQLIEKKLKENEYQSKENKKQVEILDQVKNNVQILKNIFVFEIKAVLTNVQQYSKNVKKQTSTGSNSLKNSNKKEQECMKQQTTISEFVLEGENKFCQQIQKIQITKNNMQFYNKKYLVSEEPLEINISQFNLQSNCEKISPFKVEFSDKKAPEILIEEEEQDYSFLVCDQTLADSRGKKKSNMKNKKDALFSPIIQKSIEEEQTSIKKILAERNDTNLSKKATKSIRLDQKFGNKQPTKSLPKNIIYKKFNYLKQVQRI